LLCFALLCSALLDGLSGTMKDPTVQSRMNIILLTISMKTGLK
jgi:hypothetical protein